MSPVTDATAPRGISLRDLDPGDPGWVVMRHGALNAADEGYDLRFVAQVAGLTRPSSSGCSRPSSRRAGPEMGVDRRRRRRRAAGLRFCVRSGAATARLRMFLVRPALRGTGLGQRLLDAVIGHARADGAATLVSWTQESHRAAGRLSARNGFALAHAKSVEACGRPAVAQNCELALQAAAAGPPS